MKKSFIIISILTLFISVHALESEKLNLVKSNQIICIKNSMDNNITPGDKNPYLNSLRGKNSRGQNIFKKFFQNSCKMSAKTFASKHTQDEWEEIKESGRFQEYITQLCPPIKDSYKREWTEELYRFFYRYAYDSDELLIS